MRDVQQQQQKLTDCFLKKLLVNSQRNLRISINHEGKIPQIKLQVEGRTRPGSQSPGASVSTACRITVPLAQVGDHAQDEAIQGS